MKATIATFLFISFIYSAFGQSGTYRFKGNSGASGTIAVRRSHTQMTGDIFVWWNRASGTNGSFSGKGILHNDTCVLKSVDDAGCFVKLIFNSSELKAVFNDCMTSNLPEDFSGVYKKITDHLPGEYQIATDKAYFYKNLNTQTRLKAYLVKGNKVSVDIENMADSNWIFINFTNAVGKVTSGYMPWSAFK
ncbi:hypothetical protein [Mucilaginibacter antarcticus]|uniref:SH3 domain-containing protein n=1 Tax=Mucilaginibacter antarcticus TaxID=1855725 RepID=A0ABW5XT54_9SPHI